MKKIVCVIILALITLPVFSESFHGRDVNVELVAFQTETHAENRIIFYDLDGQAYKFVYSNEFELSQAKAFLSLLLVAKQSNSQVRVFYRTADVNEEYIPFYTVLLLYT